MVRVVSPESVGVAVDEFEDVTAAATAVAVAGVVVVLVANWQVACEMLTGMEKLNGSPSMLAEAEAEDDEDADEDEEDSHEVTADVDDRAWLPLLARMKSTSTE